MTIDQQLRDRFDRETSAGMPVPDLAAAIAAGRRRRRGRGAAYAVGALAVAAVAATAVVVPRLGADPVPALAAEDGTFVPGTTIDTDLAAAVAAADPSLPAPRDVYPSDWSRDTPLPDADFANATEWQLVYDLSPEVELLVYVTKSVPGASAPSCSASGDRTVRVKDGTQTVDVPGLSCVEFDSAAGSLVTTYDQIGDPVRELWFHSMLTAPDGRFVNVIERGERRRPRPGSRAAGADRRPAGGARPGTGPGLPRPAGVAARPVASDGCLASRSRTPGPGRSPSSSATARCW